MAKLSFGFITAKKLCRCMFGYVHVSTHACYTGMSTHQATCIVACKTVKVLVTSSLGFINIGVGKMF